MIPEELLHRFGPYLPTDRYRALLSGNNLPRQCTGAALIVDISGFTPMTMQLVADYGPQRASEELRRRLNPMFEAIAGQVFIRGGSVIRFTGDGFTAWFDDQPLGLGSIDSPLLGIVRAVIAAHEMQALMIFFKGLHLRIGIGLGQAERWVLGTAEHGLNDVITGPAVEDMLTVISEAVPDQVVIHRNAVPILYELSNHIVVHVINDGHAVLQKISSELIKQSLSYRWPPWEVAIDSQQLLDHIRPFIPLHVRQQIEQGLGDFVGELRYAIPMFIQVQQQAGNVDEREVLNRYVQLVQQVVSTHGGQFISVEVSDKGSVIFCAFAVPITYGDDAVRALNAAMKIRDAGLQMKDIASQRIGLSRGLLYSGAVGGEVRHELSAIGDETNVAARLMTSARSGQVLATSFLRKEASRHIIFQELPSIMVKGRHTPVDIAEPISFKAKVSNKVIQDRFVGRNNETKLMQRVINDVRNGSHARIVTVEGVAGIGKTHFVTTILRLAAQLGFQIGSGASYSTSQNVAYFPWREVLSSLLGFTDTTPELISVRLKDFIGALEPAWLPRLPLLGDVLQIPIPDTSSTERLSIRTRNQATYALLTDLLLRLAYKQPTIICLEDVHWMDEVSELMTIDLIRRLLVLPAPILLILVHRPQSELDQPSRLLNVLNETFLRNNLVLQELSRADSYLLMERYLKAAPSEKITQFVYERSQGNPLFIQEMLDTLLDRGNIKFVGQRAVLQGELNDSDLPRTIQGLIQARLDRLSDQDKLILKVASVIGREFSASILTRALPIELTLQEVSAHLQFLSKQDFCHRVSHASQSYEFKHAITHEVIYKGLPYDQRQQLHQTVGTILEVVAPDQVELLAFHFSQTGNKAQSREYLIKAGHKAFNEYANQAALDYFDRALLLTPDEPKFVETRFGILHSRIAVMLRLGLVGFIPDYIDQLIYLAEMAGRTDWLAMTELARTQLFTQTSTWPAVVDSANKAINYARQTDDALLMWDTYLLLHNAHLKLYDLEEAEKTLYVMQPLAERLGEEYRSENRYAIQLFLTMFESLYRESPLAAQSGAQSALQQAQLLHDPVLEAECLSMVASVNVSQGNWPAALANYAQQIILFQQIGDRRAEGLCINQIASLHINLGQFQRAYAELQNGFGMLKQASERTGEATNLMHLGMLAWHRRAYDESIAYWTRALELQRTLHIYWDTSFTLFGLANAHLDKHEYDDAHFLYAQARCILRHGQHAEQLAEIDVALAYILRKTNIEQAVVVIDSHLDLLLTGNLFDMFMPSLAYVRSLEILELGHKIEDANRLAEAYFRFIEHIASHIENLEEQETFLRVVSPISLLKA